MQVPLDERPPRVCVERAEAGNGDDVYVTDLGDKATIVMRKRVPRDRDVERAESELRLSVARAAPRRGAS